MKKCHHKALEKIFAAEIEGRLPLQSKAAVFKELEILGYAKNDSEKWGNVTVSGWYLTQLGRLAYCMEC